jgi:hypothetical protein
MKSSYIDFRRHRGWPTLKELQPYVLAPPRQRSLLQTKNDNLGLVAEGVDGTEQLEPDEGRIDVDLDIWGHHELGILLIYSKWGGRLKQMYSSKGDLSRLREWIYSTNRTALPVGLFINNATAWKAVKEFIETNGDLPTSIDWISNHDLPAGTFPDR